MTTASPTTLPGPDLSASRPREVSLGGAIVRGEPVGWAVLAGLAVAVVALFWNFIDKQLGFGLFGWWGGHSWEFPEDWGHSYLVPFISGYFIWMHRKKIWSAPVGVFWPGLLPMLLGVVCYFYFLTIYSNLMFQGASMVLTLFGVVLLLLGPRQWMLLFFPVGFLLLGVTISDQVMNTITFKLQQIATVGSFVLLNMIGIETEQAGNTLIVHKNGMPIDPPLNVAEACSGMRMVIAFIALSVAFAFFGCKAWWQRIAIMSLGVPIALLMNVIRVAVLGMLSLINPELASGQAHMMIGLILLLPSFLLFMVCVWAVRNVIKEPDEHAATTKGGLA